MEHNLSRGLLLAFADKEVETGQSGVLSIFARDRAPVVPSPSLEARIQRRY